MITNRITTKERVLKLEDEIGCINKRLEEILRLLTKDNTIQHTFPDASVFPVSLFPKINQEHSHLGDTVFRKPIMYLYNMENSARQITVDFGNMNIIDSIPVIRDDGKITFSLDADSYINNKFKYLYYEIEYKKVLPKVPTVIWISNDKFLGEGLANLARLCGLWSEEVTDFVTYWDLELKRSDCKFWKCEVLTEKELDVILPINIFPKPDFFIRRYIKFSEDDKGQRLSSKTSKDIHIPTPPRMGSLRICEWGGLIADSGSFV